MDDRSLVAYLHDLFDGGEWPKPLNLLLAKDRLGSGSSIAEIAREFRTTQARVSTVCSSAAPAEVVLGTAFANVSDDRLVKVRKTLGVLVLGRAAEIAFEDIYRAEMKPSEFDLVDLRNKRSDTDYRLLNGGGRALYRINIKFFGSNFRRGPELVGLLPEDCFPLATYKIHGALQKQEQEHLPYVFVIVGVPGLNGDAIAPLIEKADVEALAWIASSAIPGKRNLEDRVVDRIVEANAPAFSAAYKRIRTAPWYLLSARRAYNLLRDKLYERVYALRVPGFAQQFRGAELDMHFSLSGDTLPLHDFFRILKDEGQTRAASLLERGTI